MTLPSQNTPGPDHAAKPAGIWSNLPFRTFIQGLGYDVGITLCFFLYDGLNQTAVDYRLLLLSALKTAVMTAISYVMKRAKPPA